MAEFDMLLVRPMDTNRIYVHVFVENSVMKDPARRKLWKRKRERIIARLYGGGHRIYCAI
jgi:hypothetical protein